MTRPSLAVADVGIVVEGALNEARAEANGPRPRFLVGSHGGIVTYAAFRQALGLPPA